MKPAVPALGLCLTAALLVGCGGSDDSGGGGGSGEYVDGATFTMALAGDPGKLDPHSSASTQLFTVNQLAYDNLVSVDSETGEIRSQLATDWAVDGTTVTLTLAKDVTCADGSALTATTVAENIAYVGDPANQSAYLGVFLPAGATAKADDAAGTVTITLAEPAPFVLNGLASLPMVCDAGLADRASLADSTSGSGPYELTEAVPGDHYTYALREGYVWGPDGATTAEKGLPATVVLKIIQNEGTATNLLLAGDLNAAAVQGPDAKRLEAADLFTTETPALVGEQWYNHAAGSPASDADVRMALTQALDLEELASVATAGAGTPATTLAAIQPTSCPGDSVSGSLPGQDVDAAKAVLDGKKLTFLYSSAAGSAVAAAAELAVQQWDEAGATVTAKGVDETALQGAVFGSGEWDIAWVPLNVNSPDQLVPFLSGAGPADGGTNFSGIDNAGYTAGVEAASATNGVEGCDAWLEAESALFAAADIVPFANNQVKTYGNGAEFEYPGQLVPTSIRMLAK
ncbi:ABC transporter substrate-binding protein [Nocardioides lianchengensis]|uniref:Peptide/nickel transport system substrate-binding protein n=1 Tax=Nocardioides lianchengensis TaxID=1045774 RepID=A0A1G6SCP5_9ACTN|nr:ABC transporter substrate-binding protein [Nocardioides lianchengensis]NYG09796.1 peptide/nickel transport system substrate-binding protein [Nocardioides lianchengensis]SDD14680.1 peptide/nickel transport system substrate-binding protein [Nocardioides lianchengensis]